MDVRQLSAIYRDYIDCLNRQDWPKLEQFVACDVRHNGRALQLAGYRAMLEENFRQIPDLHFEVGLLVCEPPYVASRLDFICAPSGEFLGLAIDGRTVSFSENVFYEFRDKEIAEVWSVIDRAAIEAQLR